MDAVDLEEMPLAAVFTAAQAILKQLQEMNDNDERAASLLEKGASAMRRAAAMVDTLGLFSPNDDKDDISTSDLKYILLPYYQGELNAQTRVHEPDARAAALQSAASHYLTFLHTVRRYNMLGSEAGAMVAALEEKQQQLDAGGGGRWLGSTAVQARLDPNTLRQQKIAKFRREKYLTARIAALELQATQQSVADSGHGEAGEGMERVGEEGEREMWLLQIEHAALQAADRLGSLQQEVEVLLHMTSIPPDQRHRQRQQQQQQGGLEPLGLLAQLQQAAGALQAGSTTGKREQLRQEVLRPSHILPTMTVEQWGEVEYRAALGRQQREQAVAAEAAAATARLDAGEEEEEEKALRKQRAWDDWLDDNPRGWGNSKLRPCG